MNNFEQLFEDAMRMKDRLQFLAGIVQNEEMMVSKEDLWAFRMGVNSLITSLEGWKKAVTKYYEEGSGGK